MMRNIENIDKPARKARGKATDADRERLRQIQATLEQYRDLLRQRRAKREFGLALNEAPPRNEKISEGYLG